MDMLVSAIITTYGRSFDMICRSIDSVVRQTYKHIEIILVDDNYSQSEFRKDIKNNIKKYPQIIYLPHNNNLGVQSARNSGIRKSRGELVAFLDDDDEWLPEKIKMQVEKYITTPGCGLVYTKGYTRVERENQACEEVPYITAYNFFDEVTYDDLLYADRIGTTSQVLVEKTVFEKVGLFDVMQPARQDYEMWIRISKCYRCVGVNEFLFIHYKHEGEQISKSMKNAIIGMNNIYKKNKDCYNENNIAKSHLMYILSIYHKKNKDYLHSLKYILRAGYFLLKYIFKRRV